MRIKHKFLPRQLNPETEILIVGTFNPGINANRANFFYSRGHTSFWELMSAIFGEKCLRYSEKQEKEDFIKRHKIDFADLIEEIDITAQDLSSYKDITLDENWNVVKCKNIPQEISHLNKLKKVCFTRRTFQYIPNIQKKVEELELWCKNKGIEFRGLTTPANYGKVDAQKRFEEWKAFFKEIK